jgi:hypothetical protein
MVLCIIANMTDLYTPSRHGQYAPDLQDIAGKIVTFALNSP